MTREELMMVVVEAARGIYDCVVHTRRPIPINALADALSALDAHRPEPDGETKELHANVWHNPNVLPSLVIIDASDEPIELVGWHIHATITARVPLPRIPEIRAIVAPMEAEG